MVDDLVARADEGRGRRRNLSGRCQQPLIRWTPNGETQLIAILVIPFLGRGTWGTETSQYPEEEKIIMIPWVAVSEKGKAQTLIYQGVVGFCFTLLERLEEHHGMGGQRRWKPCILKLIIAVQNSWVPRRSTLWESGGTTPPRLNTLADR